MGTGFPACRLLAADGGVGVGRCGRAVPRVQHRPRAPGRADKTKPAPREDFGLSTEMQGGTHRGYVSALHMLRVQTTDS